MSKKPQRTDNLVQMQVLVPKDIRDSLQRIWATSGLTISQQVRHSLGLWVQAHNKDPQGMDARIAAREIRSARAAQGRPQKGLEAPIDLANDPEPDPTIDPVAWSAWAARQGNKAVADLAAGHWPDSWGKKPGTYDPEDQN